jgi:hypothetical protein
LGDAAILWVVEASSCDVFITWNVKHFREKTHIMVQTPEEWLAEKG